MQLMYMATGAPTFWSTVSTHRPLLRFDALDTLSNTTSWPAPLQLACHGSVDLCAILQDVATHLRHDHATVRVLHDHPPADASTCSEHAAQLSALALAAHDTADTMSIRVASSSLCSRPTAAHGTHATALILPPKTLDSSKIAGIIQQLLHGAGHTQSAAAICITSTSQVHMRSTPLPVRGQAMRNCHAHSPHQDTSP